MSGACLVLGFAVELRVWGLLGLRFQTWAQGVDHVVM